MPEIRKDGGIVTQITTVKVEPEHQAEVLKLMVERARFMARQPGFVSVNLHRSTGGSHIVNYIQWRDRQHLERRTTRLSSARSGRASASWSRMSSRASTRWC